MSTLVRAIPLATLTLALACQDASQPPTNLGARLTAWIPDSAATLAFEYYSGFDEATRLVVDDGSTWGGVWTQLTSGR